jgi:anaerobic selenocysteine-containing dehydrogenase
MINTTCTLCPGACGITCRIVDGSLVDIMGNVFNPINRGGICPTGMAALELLYSPDRLHGPRVREGEKGGGKWRDIEWDEALSILNEKLTALKRDGKMDGVAFLSGASSGSMADLIHTFVKGTGRGTIYLDDRLDAYPHVFNLMHGIPRYPAFDLKNTDTIFSFGVDLLNAWYSPLQAQGAYGDLKGRSVGSKGDLIQIEHRLSRTGTQAAEWVPIKPGTYGALALGMAYVLIKEDLFDHDFITRRTTGFDSWIDADGTNHIGMRDLILQFYYPEEVSRITGVKEETILRLGKKFGNADHAVAVGDIMVSYQTNGLFSLMAVHTLNLLKGNVGRSGGITVQRDLSLVPLPGGKAGDVSSPGSGERYLAESGIILKTEYPRINKFPEKVLWQSQQNVGMDLLFVYRTNPVFSQIDGDAFQKALQKIPFVVSFSSVMDETSCFADLVIPDDHFLEKWEDAFASPTFPYSVWGVVKPVVSQVHNTKNAGDVLLRLLEKFGDKSASTVKFKDMEELLRYRAKGLFEAGRGMVLDGSFERHLAENLEGRGWWIKPKYDFDKFWDLLIERGGWYDPFVDWENWAAVCGNRDKKVHFFIPELGEIEGKDLGSLPHHEDVEITKDIDYPFLLVPFRMSKIDDGEGTRVPWVIESNGPMAGLTWESWVEINPVTADKVGIKDGDLVWLESRRGKIQLRARVFEGIVEGVLSVPIGMGHRYGMWAKAGANVMEILEEAGDKRSGLPSWQSTPVKIYRA